MNFKNENILISGGNGFLGSCITKFLIRQNCKKISVLCRSEAKELKKLGVELLSGDIRDPQCLERAFLNKTIVFHVAAKAGIWGKKNEFFDINVNGTKNVIGACLSQEVPALVYTSSPSVVIPDGDIENASEDIPYPKKYLAWYPESKAIAERLVLSANSANLATVSLRPHLIWGPSDPHILPRIIDKARKKRLFRIGNGKNMVDLCFIENAANAHLLAADDLRNSQKSVGKAYFISDGKPVNLWDWIDNFLSILGIEKTRRAVSYKTAYNIGFLLEILYGLAGIGTEPPITRFAASQLAHSHYFNISAAKKDFGYIPLADQNEAISKTAEYFANK